MSVAYVGRVHRGAGVCSAGEDEADGGDGEHRCLDDGVAGSLDDDAEDGEGDDEGEHPFCDGAGVRIHLERGAAEHVLVLFRHELRDGQSSAHGAGGLPTNTDLIKFASVAAPLTDWI